MDPRLTPLQYNPFDDAMDHATQMMQIGQKQAQLKQQQQFLDNATQEHNLNVSQKIISSLDDINKTAHPQLRAAKADALSEGYQRITGKPLDDGLMAVLKSQTPHDDYINAVSTLSATPLDPDTRAKTLPKIIPFLGQEGSIDLVTKLAGDATNLQAAQLHAQATKNSLDATNARFATGQKTRDVKSGLAELDKGITMPVFQLTAIKRADDLIDDGLEKHKFKTNGQLFNAINNDMNRAEFGSGVIADANLRS